VGALSPPRAAPPEGDWYLWAIVGGRGSGKTRAAIEWLADELRGDGRGDESAVVAPTFGDARDTCVEGPSGLRAALERRGITVAAWNRTQGHAAAQVGGHRAPRRRKRRGVLRIKGHNFRRAVCDELGLWEGGAGERAWDESLLPAVRMGEPRIVVATTPKPTRLMRQLLDDPTAHVTRMTTFDNTDNLAPGYLDQMQRRYEGTRLGRQELLGELVLEVEGALWRHEWIEEGRVEEVPHPSDVRQVVVGLDPADGSPGGAQQGLAVCAVTYQGEFYVLQSEGRRETPLAWLKRAILTAKEHGATLLVEKNHGGGFLMNLMQQAARELGVSPPYRPFDARPQSAPGPSPLPPSMSEDSSTTSVATPSLRRS
jgi:phage terminase large subunit-like protein